MARVPRPTDAPAAPLDGPLDARRRPRDAVAAARELERFRARVYKLVAMIPSGQVATYGQISLLAGHPRRARHVGNAMRHAPPGDLPWHRVINAQGKVSARAGESRPRGDEPVERRQRRLLAAEGIQFKGDRVDLERYRWRPEEQGAAFLQRLRSGKL